MIIFRSGEHVSGMRVSTKRDGSDVADPLSSLDSDTPSAQSNSAPADRVKAVILRNQSVKKQPKHSFAHFDHLSPFFHDGNSPLNSRHDEN